MHKVHWGGAALTVTLAIVVSMMPASSMAKEIQHTTTHNIAATNSGELIHALLVLSLVMAAVAFSRAVKKKTKGSETPKHN